MQEINETLLKITADQKNKFITLHRDKVAEHENDADDSTDFCGEYVVQIIDAVIAIIEAIKIKIDEIPPEKQKQLLGEWTKKSEFVKNYLSPMLVAADMNVKGAVYFYDIFSGEEYVNIIDVNGHDHRVCVIADSLRSLILDVMRKVEAEI